MFTKRKFQSLSIPIQHKKCSELLKIIYQNLLIHHSSKDLFNYYLELCDWMNDESVTKLDLEIKQIADRYHYHLKLAHRNLLEHNFLPSIRKGDREESEKIWPYTLYLDHLRSAHNVGSIIRTVEAFGFGSIYFSDQTPFIDNKQVQDASMGATQWVQCYQQKKIHEIEKPLIVLETATNAISLYDFIFPQTFTLAVGNEEYGCSEEVLRLADFIIEIPLRGRKNSLNVANAFAITAGEILRQKKE